MFPLMSTIQGLQITLGRGYWGEVESEWGRRLESVSRYLRFLGRVACITSQLFIRVSKQGREGH